MITNLAIEDWLYIGLLVTTWFAIMIDFYGGIQIANLSNYIARAESGKVSHLDNVKDYIREKLIRILIRAKTNRSNIVLLWLIVIALIIAQFDVITILIALAAAGIGRFTWNRESMRIKTLSWLLDNEQHFKNLGGL